MFLLDCSSKSMSTSRWYFQFHWVFYLSFPLAISYFVYPQYLLKAAPIWACAIASGLQTHRYGRTVAVALLFGSAGDILLEQGDRYFLPGLASFLVGHLCYIRAFYHPIRARTWPLALPPLLVYYGLSMGFLLSQAEMVLIGPIAVYALVLCTVVFCAANRYLCDDRMPIHTRVLALTGSLFFLSSDSMLSFNAFYHRFEGAGYAVMLTYYIAQILLSASAQLPLDVEMDDDELVLGTQHSKSLLP
jgi:alkenylglycerophosphocholine hydrolase